MVLYGVGYQPYSSAYLSYAIWILGLHYGWHWFRYFKSSLGRAAYRTKAAWYRFYARQSRHGRDEQIVGIDLILGMAYLIPDIDVPGEYWVNSRINLETLNEIY